MSYQLKRVRIKNFKCFDDSKFYEYEIKRDRNPIILSGPNGYGKTTFFDALQLIFSKRVTRIDNSIENGNKKFSNIYLNNSNTEGYICVDMIDKDEEEYKTVIARIGTARRHGAYEEALEVLMCGECIDTDNLEDYIKNQTGWEKSIKDFKQLQYAADSFDIYYYVSQAESVHFLKNKISERKDTLNALLNFGNVDAWIAKIEDVIGKTAANKNAVVNNYIEKTKQECDVLKEKYKEAKAKYNIAEGEVAYSRITDSEIIPEWDQENLDAYDISKLKVLQKEFNRVKQYVKNIHDYEKYARNNARNIDVGQHGKKYLTMMPFIDKGEVNERKINDYIWITEKNIEIYNNSAFLRSEKLDYSLFDIEKIARLNELDASIIDFDIKYVEDICKELKAKQEGIAEQGRVLTKILQAREKLHDTVHAESVNDAKCPYCGHIYDEQNTLEDAFLQATDWFSMQSDEDSKRVMELSAELKKCTKEARRKIQQLFVDCDDAKIAKIKQICNARKDLYSDKDALEPVKRISQLVEDKTRIEQVEIYKQYDELCRICKEKEEIYDNDNFEEERKTYQYDKIHEEYEYLNSENLGKFSDAESVVNKEKYIQRAIDIKQQSELNQILDNLKKKMLEVKKALALRSKLNDLKAYYETEEQNYKNSIMKDLRVPLLLYTGRILQDFQCGLGVYMEDEDMRFTASEGEQHDILNTFSSGQLSGFSLAFMLAMNRLYIDDDLGFILIDDPVQTLDDINIASFVDVLRNDFKDRQIILSTHESDKENYILYKFLKYGSIGQSINVKNQLYSV